MVCLDSDVIIDFLRNESYAVKKMKEFSEKGKISTTSINVFELIKGALRAKQENAIESIEGFLSNLSILDFDFESGKKGAEIFEGLRKKGETIDVLDLIIASIAIVNEEPLFTKNVRHFKRIPELRLQDACLPSLL